MATPDPSNVAPWYLRNINQALALDETTGNVYVRTGFEGNIIISGNVNIPGNVDAHISEIGTSGNLTVPYMPIAGNITIDPGQTVAVTQSTSPWVVSGTVTANVTPSSSTDYYMSVARGLVTGQYNEMKNAVSPSMSSGSHTIWSQDSLYPWASWTTAQKLYIVSSSASDTGQTLRLEGLDASYNKITEDVTTNGTTAVQTTQNFLRLNRGYLIAGNTNVGTITERLVSGSGTIVGGMAVGYGRNKQGVFTVPNGYTAYILYGDVTSFKNGQGQIDGQIDMYVRTSQSAPFLNAFAAGAGNGQYRNEFNVPLPIPQRSDIDVRFSPSANGVVVSCNWEMILIPN